MSLKPLRTKKRPGYSRPFLFVSPTDKQGYLFEVLLIIGSNMRPPFGIECYSSLFKFKLFISKKNQTGIYHIRIIENTTVP
jgi:hypothetical protein